jgi:hypothetical protein
MLVEGVHPKVVQERLGHASIVITMDIYSHVMPNMQADAAAKIDEALKAAQRRRGSRRNDSKMVANGPHGSKNLKRTGTSPQVLSVL